MNADGTGQVQLTAGSVRDSVPAFSPDGNRVAFVRSGTAGCRAIGIYILDLAKPGSLPTRLTRGCSGAPQYDPDWAPNGGRLAVTVGFNNPRIGVLDARTGTINRFDGPGGMPEWTPDGRRIARFVLPAPDGTPRVAAKDNFGDAGIYTRNIDGTGRREVTFEPSDLLGDWQAL